MREGKEGGRGRRERGEEVREEREGGRGRREREEEGREGETDVKEGGRGTGLEIFGSDYNVSILTDRERCYSY